MAGLRPPIEVGLLNGHDFETSASAARKSRLECGAFAEIYPIIGSLD